MLATIPRLEQRVRCVLFKMRYDDAIEAAQSDLRALREATEATIGCTRLHALLQAVLEVGNELNAGTAKGGASGFKLSSLLKFCELRSAQDAKVTLVHYVAETLLENDADHLLDVRRTRGQGQHTARAPSSSGDLPVARSRACAPAPPDRAPPLRPQVRSELGPIDAAQKLGLSDLQARSNEWMDDLEKVDREILTAEQNRVDVPDEARYSESLTFFYNTASELHEVPRAHAPNTRPPRPPRLPRPPSLRACRHGCHPPHDSYAARAVPASSLVAGIQIRPGAARDGRRQARAAFRRRPGGDGAAPDPRHAQHVPAQGGEGHR
jgi:hypothetical protein